jgi:CIC family chloride channel protein
LAKIFAVSITLSSGGSGGIFAPSLFIGAMLGGAIGIILNNIWPGEFANSGAYALVGMGAVVGATTHAPITAIIIIFELTNDYKIILPLMISCIIATILSTRLLEGSIYTIKLLRRGINIHKGHSINIMKDFKVRLVMKTDFVTIPANENLMSIISRFIDQPGNSLYVVDEDGNLAGIITLDDIRPIIPSISSLDNLLIAEDLMIRNNFPKFHPDDNLTDVMKHLGSHNYDAPVVSNGRIVGCIWPEDVINLYNAEVFRRDTAEGFLSNIDSGAMPLSIPGSDNLKLAEIPVPPGLIGKKLGELDIRKRLGVTVILLKRKIKGKTHLVDTVPSADTVLEESDIILAMGPESGLRRIEAE